MDEVILYKNLSELSITKEKKLSLLVIVLLEINFGNNNSLFNKIIEYLTNSKIIDCDITSDEYINARTKLFNLINDLNSSNTKFSNARWPIGLLSISSIIKMIHS